VIGKTKAYKCSIGNALVEALDTFIAEGRIEPQIAIGLLQHFDRVIAEVLSTGVKSRLTFKVC
jgi:transcription initiation factor TFIIA small subunit